MLVAQIKRRAAFIRAAPSRSRYGCDRAAASIRAATVRERAVVHPVETRQCPSSDYSISSTSMSIAPSLVNSGSDRSASTEFFSDDVAKAMRMGLQSVSRNAASTSIHLPST